jgi:hypothetical protein
MTNSQFLGADCDSTAISTLAISTGVLPCERHLDGARVYTLPKRSWAQRSFLDFCRVLDIHRVHWASWSVRCPGPYMLVWSLAISFTVAGIIGLHCRNGPHSVEPATFGSSAISFTVVGVVGLQYRNGPVLLRTQQLGRLGRRSPKSFTVAGMIGPQCSNQLHPTSLSLSRSSAISQGPFEGFSGSHSTDTHR